MEKRGSKILNKDKKFRKILVKIKSIIIVGPGKERQTIFMLLWPSNNFFMLAAAKGVD